jgi:mono/diheme cytochrome c family protein
MTTSLKKFGLLAASMSALWTAGCRQDMHDQPKYIPLRESKFFNDGRSARLPVEHTVARGQLREDTYFYTGKRNGKPGNELPNGLLHQGYGMRELLVRGQERYNIYCAPCHSPVGDGNGMVAQRGLTSKPRSFHEPKIKQDNLGHFYDVMTNGFGAMLNYSAQITPEDRWAIAAYIRALQLSQDAKLEDVPPQDRARIRELPRALPQGSTVQPGSSESGRPTAGEEKH